MEREPIYCAEQIRVHAALADVLKGYAKAVIRGQPEDLLWFSARYFADLAAQPHSSSGKSSNSGSAQASDDGNGAGARGGDSSTD